MSMTDLPEWLPGQWDLASYSVSQGGRTMYLPTNLGSLPFATSLTFTQGSPTFDLSGGPVPPGKGKVTIKDGVVHLEIPVPATIAPSLPATIAKMPEGMVVSFSLPIPGGRPTEYKVYYTRAAEEPEWLPGKWDVAHNTQTLGGRTSDFPGGAGGIQIATSLTFTQGSPTYEYPFGPVPLDKGKIRSHPRGRIVVRRIPDRGRQSTDPWSRKGFGRVPRQAPPFRDGVR